MATWYGTAEAVPFQNPFLKKLSSGIKWASGAETETETRNCI
jgi:hypothetical protein